MKEFRFFYSTGNYEQTVSFYRDKVQLKEIRSWDRGPLDRGTVFESPNGVGRIEIEEGPAIPLLEGGLYIEVDDVDDWYRKLTRNGVHIAQPPANTSYGHRQFRFLDPNQLRIGLFQHLALSK